MATTPTSFAQTASQQKWRFVFISMATLLFGITIACCVSNYRDAETRGCGVKGGKALHKATIRLLSGSDAIEGIIATERPAGRKRGVISSRQPMLVCIVTPERKNVLISSKITFITITYGKVSSVMVSPMMKASTFRETVDALRHVIQKNDLKPDAIMQGRMARLPTDQPGNERWGGRGGALVERLGRAWVSPTVTVDVTINPAPIKGWYLSMEFKVIQSEYWKLYPPGRRPKQYRELTN